MSQVTHEKQLSMPVLGEVVDVDVRLFSIGTHLFQLSLPPLDIDYDAFAPEEEPASEAAGSGAAAAAPQKKEKSDAAEKQEADPIVGPESPEVPPDAFGFEVCLLRVRSGYYVGHRGTGEFQQLPPPGPGLFWELKMELGQDGEKKAFVQQRNQSGITIASRQPVTKFLSLRLHRLAEVHLRCAF
jgi:hypothetical protein